MFGRCTSFHFSQNALSMDDAFYVSIVYNFKILFSEVSHIYNVEIKKRRKKSLKFN